MYDLKFCKTCNNQIYKKNHEYFGRWINKVYCSNKCSSNDLSRKRNSFFKKVLKTESCWLYTGRLNEYGYGVFHLSYGGMKAVSAHRASYMFHFNSIPDGLFVLHKCDIRNCVNPDHLWLGTQKENVMDCLNKGRLKRKGKPGESNSMSKLSEEEVIKIRKIRNETGISYKRIAKLFNISTMTALRAIKKQSWSHI